MNHAEMEKRINDEGDTNGFDDVFARYVSERYRVHVADVVAVIENEKAYLLDNKLIKGIHKYAKAQQVACKRINSWLWQAPNDSLQLTSYAQIASLVAGARKSYVWSIIVGKSFPIRRLLGDT